MSVNFGMFAYLVFIIFGQYPMSFNIDVFRRVFFKALNVLKIHLFLAKNVGAEIQEIYAIQGKNVSTINAYGHAVATPLLTIVHALVDLQFVVKIRFAEKKTVSHFQT